MWGALVRQLVLFLFTKRGKRVAILVGLALLCFVTALLIDSKMYLTAGVTAVVTAFLFISLIVRRFRRRALQRVRAQRQADEVLRRAAAAHGRKSRKDRAKSAVVGLARAARGSAVNLGEHAKARIAGARGHFGFWRRKRT